MEELIIIDFLKSFFNLFNAKIEEYKIIDKKIFGILGWLDEDDKQTFVLKADFDFSAIIAAKSLCDFLLENSLINGDSIVISESDLIMRLIKNGWNEKEAIMSINFLCEFDVKMIDDGEETDSFYIHF